MSPLCRFVCGSDVLPAHHRGFSKLKRWMDQSAQQRVTGRQLPQLVTWAAAKAAQADWVLRGVYHCQFTHLSVELAKESVLVDGIR